VRMDVTKSISVGAVANSDDVRVNGPVKSESSQPSDAASGSHAPVSPNLAKLFRERPDLRAAYRRSRITELQLRYTSLYRKLGLTPVEVEQFDSLYRDRQLQQWDLDEQARAKGLPRYDPSFGPARQRADDQYAEAMKSLLGIDRFREFEQYQRTIEARDLVGNLVARLYSTPTPLTGEQGDRLTDVIAAHASDVAGKVDLKLVRWENVLAETRAFLAPSQQVLLEALVEMDAMSAKATSLRPSNFKSPEVTRRDYVPKG
jgi:hypothetical protein